MAYKSYKLNLPNSYMVQKSIGQEIIKELEDLNQKVEVGRDDGKEERSHND